MLFEESANKFPAARRGRSPETGVAALSTLAGLGALFSAAACCVLPLAFAALGIGAGGLAAFVPLHWPLTGTSIAALALGWILYVRKRRACARDATCRSTPPRRLTLIMLSAATLIIAVSASWSLIEQPLMRAFGGA